MELLLASSIKVSAASELANETSPGLYLCPQQYIFLANMLFHLQRELSEYRLLLSVLPSNPEPSVLVLKDFCFRLSQNCAS